MSALLSGVICRLFHRERKVVTAYSNYTHRWRCACGREWDD